MPTAAKSWWVSPSDHYGSGRGALMTEAPEVLELRVHGVSGTPPHAMLGVPDPTGVLLHRGDQLTGFYRAHDPASTSGPPLPGHAVREAYSWGALTASATGLLGGLQRALWLTLLPFALVNVAMWARPGLSVPGARRWLAAWLVRLAGLLCTALLVATACGIGIDMVAWQCYRNGVPSCPALPAALDFLADETFSPPGRRIAVAQLLPLAVLVAFWWLSAYTMRRYEEYETNRTSPGDSPAAPLIDGVVPVLARGAMWNGAPRTLVLRRAHLSLGVAVIVWFTAWPLTRGSSPFFSLSCVAAAALAAAALLIISMGISAQPEYSESDGPADVIARAGSASSFDQSAGVRSADRTGLRTSRVVLVLSLVVLLAHTAVLWWGSSAGRSPPADLPGAGALVEVLVLGLFGTAAALVGVARSAWAPALLALPVLGVLLALQLPPGSPARGWALLGAILLPAVLAHWWHRRADRPTLAWDGAAPAFFIGAAALVAVLFSTGATLVAGNWLNGDPGVPSLVVRHTDVPIPDRLRLAPGTWLEDGRIEVKDGAVVVRKGLLRTATLADADADAVHPLLPSSRLTDQTLELPDGLLFLVDTTVEEDGDDVLTTGSLVLRDDGDPAVMTVETAADPPVRAVSGATSAVLSVPAPYLWFAAFLLPLVLLLVVILAGCAALVYWRTRRAVGDLADDELPRWLSEARRGARRKARRRRRVAAIPHRAEAVLSVAAVPLIGAALATTIGLLLGRDPWTRPDDGWLGFVAEQGRYLASGIAVLLVLLGARLRGSASLRRGVGVLWDLSTFWPRTGHPFGPPCYAERVVPEITARACDMLDDGGRVVLSGHSQGSTVLVAVLWQLPHDERLERVFFISYGSQLRTWFGRVFPDLLGPGVLGCTPTTRPRLSRPEPDAPLVDGRTGGPYPGMPERPPTASLRLDHTERPPHGTLAHLLGVGSGDPRWRSLFRRTDPIGFRVYRDEDLNNPVDRAVLEVVTFPDRRAPAIATHGDYPRSPEYGEEVELWLRGREMAAGGGPLRSRAQCDPMH